jgi:hypothetical protein
MGGKRTQKVDLVFELVVPLLETINFVLEVGEVGVALHLHALRGPDERDGESRSRTELAA